MQACDAADEDAIHHEARGGGQLARVQPAMSRSVVLAVWWMRSASTGAEGVVVLFRVARVQRQLEQAGEQAAAGDEGRRQVEAPQVCEYRQMLERGSGQGNTADIQSQQVCGVMLTGIVRRCRRVRRESV